MKRKFVMISNVQAFLDGYEVLGKRAAPEASLMLVSGDAGYGKSETAAWWAEHSGTNAIHVRLKAASTPHWLLTDVVRELRIEPEHTCEKLFAQVMGALAGSDRPLVVDEIEAGLHDIKVIETLRDISDVTEVPVIMVGREYVAGKLRRHRQIDSRISARVEFKPATESDVALLARELCKVEMKPDLLNRIREVSGGRLRNIVKLLAQAEHEGRRTDGAVGLGNIDESRLFRDYAPLRKAS